MPRILIKETDETSAGTPSSYENYSVLIIGFSKYTEEERKNRLADSQINTSAPDTNGVYEFNSKSVFENTIGLVAPEVKYSYECTELVDGKQETVEKSGELFHYGNQMAYELLGLGYTVIYKPITIDNVINTKIDNEYSAEQITSDDFWSIFKDKASYDFRFISHGFLSATDVTKIDNYYENNKRLDVLEHGAEILKEIVSEADRKFKSTDGEFNAEAYTPNGSNTQVTGEFAWWAFAEDEYQKIIADLSDEDETLCDADGVRYVSFGDDVVLNVDNEAMSFNNVGAYFGVLGVTRYKTLSTDTFVVNELETVTNEFTKSVAGKFAPHAFNEVNGQIANLAKYIKDDENKYDIPGRGDCVALIELDENSYINITKKPESAIVEGINSISQINADNGKYCAMTVPSVVYKMSDNANFGNNKKFPGAFHYLACFKNSLGLGFAEWYAAAGYTRGVSSYIIDHTTVKLGEIAINALEPRNMADANAPKFACNVIANFRGSYYLWGNRTAHPLGSKAGGNDLVASHFLNIRQLCTTIKKQLYIACRRFTFDPNSDTLWINFCAAIRPTLEAMKADQGVRDYKIVKEFTDKKATLKAKIRIIPIEAVEDFDLEVSLEDSFGETTAVVNE